MKISKFITNLTLSMLLALLVACAHPPSNSTTSKSSSAGNSLLDDLASIAERHQMSQQELINMVARLATEGKALDKGGVGIVNNSVYVNTQAATNQLMINSQWQDYGSRNDRELLVLGDNRVLNRIPLSPQQAQSITLVIYTPEHIRFIDLNRVIGGVYDRK